MNAVISIHPYKSGGLWVFDDEPVGLMQEPFIAGADTVIDYLVRDIPDAASGFTILFSGEPFPGYQVKFQRRREDMGGNWYYSPDLDLEGWLCPALLRYFEAAPQTIYAQFRARG